MTAYIAAAKAYPTRLSSPAWLDMKPFDQSWGHGEFFYNMHNALGLLQAMALPQHAEILEVGCGPGWLTEILALLGYRVTAFDPSERFIEIARQRLNRAAKHHLTPAIVDNVHFAVSALEDLQLADDSFDGIIFYDVLHHIVDEEAGLANCARWLRPNGVLGIIEGAWSPGATELEAALLREMAEYGTLENPFTQEYLEHLLTCHGFVRIQRLVGRSGFAPSCLKDLTIEQLASQPLASRNDLIARKSDGRLYSSDPTADSRVALALKGVREEGGRLILEIVVRNDGQTVLIGGRPSEIGAISFALRRGEVHSPDMAEALNRVPMNEDLAPGGQIEMVAEFRVPKGEHSGWILDTVVEHVAWLSAKGSNSLEIAL